MRPETKNVQHNGVNPARKRGLMTRLASDQHGNALMMTAAFLLPVCAAIGGGVDMSRAYLAKARLNQACDAAALAGRRAMSNEDVETAKPEARKFLNFNFPQGTMGTAAFIPKITRPDTGVIRVEAATTVPTSIMRVFSYEQIPISVECEAKQNYDNIDIVLVVDTTGSMGSILSGEQKIVSLRKAVLALYDELATAQSELTAQGLRLRYGIVPYSSGVNIGSLIFEVDPRYLIGGNPRDIGGGIFEERHTYQSREMAWDVSVSGSPTSSSDQTWPVRITEAECKGYALAPVTNANVPDPVTGVIPATPVTKPTRTWAWNRTTDTGITPVLGTCVITTHNTTSTYTPKNQWNHGLVSIDVSRYVRSLATYNPASSLTRPNVSTWNGCIEERGTDSSITATTPANNIPAGARDLNIDLVPDVNDNLTRWGPAWSSAVYTPSGSPVSSTCPSPARRLAVMTRAEMETYVNGLIATGSTYHDFGMIWGTRLISRNGIFAPDLAGRPDTGNPQTFPPSMPRPINKYIIYMTDGVLEPNSDIYANYGVETWAQRIMGGTPGTSAGSGASSPLAAVHRRRFLMACNEAKQRDVSIWTIAFGTSATAELRSCASNADQVATSSNSAQLIAKFKEIGKNIGTLRLAK